MNDPTDQTRRAFLNLGAAAGASLLVDAGLSVPAAAAPEKSSDPSLISAGMEWAVRGKVLQVPEPDHLESLPDALIVIGPDGVISRLEKADGEVAAGFQRA